MPLEESVKSEPGLRYRITTSFIRTMSKQNNLITFRVELVTGQLSGYIRERVWTFVFMFNI